MKSGGSPLPMPRPPCRAELRPSMSFAGGGRIPEAMLMVGRARACRAIAERIAAARRASGLTRLRAARRSGMDWRLLWNIETTGMFLLPDRELRDLWLTIDIGFALGGRALFRLEDAGRAARLARIERKLGLRPYVHALADGGIRPLFAGRGARGGSGGGVRGGGGLGGGVPGCR